MSEKENPVYRVCEYITSRAVDGEVFLMDIRSLYTYSLNSTASFVWSLIDGRRSREDIRLAVMERYAIAPEVCDAQIAKLLSLLESEHLISPAGHDA